MTEKYSQTNIHRFIKNFVESKNGELTEQSDQTFLVKLPNNPYPTQYTYDPAVAREKNAVLITLGSPTFQQMLRECSEVGTLCRITLSPKEGYETLLKAYFKDTLFTCEGCSKLTMDNQGRRLCEQPKPCYHQMNNGKIVSIRIAKTKPTIFFQFYFSVVFQNRLRAKNEEIIKILVDEKGNQVEAEENFENTLVDSGQIHVEDSRAKINLQLFDDLKKSVDRKLNALIEEKLILFDLPLIKEKNTRLRNFTSRFRRERREQVISKHNNFDYVRWQANYDMLLRREEESLTTAVTVKLLNLLVVDTICVNFEISIDNGSTVKSSFILGITQPEVICPICRKPFFEGYATQDHFYVCENCIRQSVDTAKIYSKKASLRLDETLGEYIEADMGFVCSVCGKRHSRLLEFKCSHDHSSVCIYHYDRCDVCGETFSKANLFYTDEFRRRLCPKHASKETIRGALT
ncbi:MAG: hypothetical protein NWE98_11580 [Candidatus Bathyarchaeota archaeon]|nr:hypothetical protein [Candidatus Bathyarchaeota archaeon]